MDYLAFLEEGDQDKIKLLKILQQHNEQFITKKRVLELTGFSKFLLDKYLDEISTETPAITIQEEYFDELTYAPISNDIVQEIQYNYAKNSLRFSFFIEMLVEEKSAKRFQEDHHIGKTNFYHVRMKVLTLLKREKYTIRRNELVGDEQKIRSLIYNVVSYFYFGKQVPFASEHNSNGKNLAAQLISYFTLDLSLLQKQKLQLFLSIMQIRTKNRHFLTESFSSLDDETQQKYDRQLSEIQKNLMQHTTDKVNFSEEVNYLFLFLYLSDMIQIEPLLKPNLLIRGTEAVEQLLLQLPVMNISEEQQADLDRSFLKIFLSFSIFRQTYTTFVDPAAYTYFSEVYPLLHKSVLQFIHQNSFLESLLLTKNDQVKLYYDILFSTVTQLQPSQLEEQVNIYVDFSHSTAYTTYIQRNLERFRDLNINIQRKLNNQTQIFLSDYEIPEVLCHQIIWKQPPTPSDWAMFADLIIKLREENHEPRENDYMEIF